MDPIKSEALRSKLTREIDTYQARAAALDERPDKAARALARAWRRTVGVRRSLLGEAR